MNKEYPNKISQAETLKFTPDKFSGEEYTYHHDNDCEPTGCPGHKAQIKYHSTADIVTMKFGNLKEVTLDGAEINILWDWINRVKI